MIRLDVLNHYLAKADPLTDILYIMDLKASIEQEIKTPTKNYTQECFGWIGPMQFEVRKRK